MRYLALILFLILTMPLCAQEIDTTGNITPADEEYTEEYSEGDDADEYSEGSEEEGEENPHTLLNPTEVKSSEEYQSENIYHRTFDENKWRDIVGDNDYQQKMPDPPNIKLPSANWSGDILKAVGYTLILALVLLLLYFVFRSVRFKSRPRYNTVAPYNSDEENIEEMDLPNLLKKALDEKNFKLAIRYYYLSVLKGLHEAGIIRWERDKTNRDYLYEVFAKEFHYDEMKSLTRNYEEVWYGDHRFEDDTLRTLIGRFETLHSKINSTKPL